MPPDADWREREALFRHRLVAEAADPALSSRERGVLVRALAARAHPDPQGLMRRVARSTLDEWIRALRRGGFEALKPAERLVAPRTPLSLLEEAEALRREAPERTGALIGEILRRRYGELAPSERTITRHLARQGLTRARLLGPERAFGRFEASRPNEMWTADVLHGPVVAGRKALLFGILDDHSRFVVAARFAYLETTLAFQQVLRPAFMSRGLPERLYLDNASSFSSEPLERTLALLGVRLVHSQPGRPQGRGKVERLFRTIRDGFLTEAARRRLCSLAELERLLAAWLSQVYHRRVHSETGESPQARYRRVTARYPEPDRLREAFLWRTERTVSATALVSLAGNRYEVAPELCGRKVELLYDPQDLTVIRVRQRGRDHGLAVPHRITRHVHQAAEDPAPAAPAPATGIDYLELVERAERDALRRQIAYRQLAGEDEVVPR
jgi:putative transposase